MTFYVVTFKKEIIMENRVAMLEEKAIELRKTILTMIHEAGSGHPGGSLSAADYVTALYFDEMNIYYKRLF